MNPSDHLSEFTYEDYKSSDKEIFHESGRPLVAAACVDDFARTKKTGGLLF